MTKDMVLPGLRLKPEDQLDFAVKVSSFPDN